MKSEFLDKLADVTPTPAGGSAAAFTAAEAAALVAMSAKLTIGKKNYLSVQDKMQISFEKAENWRHQLANFVDIDALAYQKLIGAYRLPQTTAGESIKRTEAITKAAFHAADVPLQMARISLQVMAEAVMLISSANIHTIADVASAAALCFSAITCAGYNVKFNLLAFRNKDEASIMIREINEIQLQAEEFLQKTRLLMKERGGI